MRIVALPEKMVVEETKRNFLYLNLFGYRVDGLVVNRVLPPEAQGGFFAEWADVQKRCMEELAQVFGDLPRAQVPWYGADVCGLEAVRRLAAELPDDAVFAAAPPVEHERYERTDAGLSLIHIWITSFLGRHTRVRTWSSARSHDLEEDFITY